MVTQAPDVSELLSLKAEFEDQGYLVLRNVLPQDKVARLNAAIDEMLAGEPPALSHNLYHTVERHDEVLSLIDHPAVVPLVVNLLGANIQLHISHLTVRQPNPDNQKTESNSFINWHQDGPHPHFPRIGGLTGTYYIKACFILSDMSQPDRGNTKVIPGSHRVPDFKPASTSVDDVVQGEVQVCGQPGDVFLFPQNLWHAGAPNRSQHTRRQLFLGYSPLWMRPIDYHQASDALLAKANAHQRQLLGAISDNKFNYYVPREGMLPLKAYEIKPACDAKACL